MPYCIFAYTCIHIHMPTYLYMADSVVASEHSPKHYPQLPFIINILCAALC